MYFLATLAACNTPTKKKKKLYFWSLTNSQSFDLVKKEFVSCWSLFFSNVSMWSFFITYDIVLFFIFYYWKWYRVNICNRKYWCKIVKRLDIWLEIFFFRHKSNLIFFGNDGNKTSFKSGIYIFYVLMKCQCHIVMWLNIVS